MLDMGCQGDCHDNDGAGRGCWGVSDRCKSTGRWWNNQKELYSWSTKTTGL